MNNEKTKKETFKTLPIMIQQADKGPSGFWVDDYEGCGNPEIFPEFAEGLKRGRLIQKEHYLCPWNTAVLYGKGYGNIVTGCYYSCSIKKAKYLSAEMIKDVLIRFKKRLESGLYDSTEDLSPLLTDDEIDYIEDQIKKANKLREQKYQEERKARLEKASAMIKKYPDKKGLFAIYYGENVVANTYDGIIDFNPNGYKEVVGAEKFAYDDYIDVQIKSFYKIRSWFAQCFHNISLGFKGCIERKKTYRLF